MNTQEQAYINGFVKRASEYGINEEQAVKLLKKANRHEEEIAKGNIAADLRLPMKPAEIALVGKFPKGTEHPDARNNPGLPWNEAGIHPDYQFERMKAMERNRIRSNRKYLNYAGFESDGVRRVRKEISSPLRERLRNHVLLQNLVNTPEKAQKHTAYINKANKREMRRLSPGIIDRLKSSLGGLSMKQKLLGGLATAGLLGTGMYMGRNKEEEDKAETI